MTYRDKSRGVTVTLKPSATDFLAISRSEGEGIRPAMQQKLFAVTRSTNADRVFILRARSDQESAVALEREVAQLRQDPEFESIVPGLIDQSGITRFALPNRVLVKVRDGGAQARQAIVDAGGSILRTFPRSHLLDVEVPAGTTVEAMIEQLNALDDVVFAEPSFYGVDDQEVSFTASVRARPGTRRRTRRRTTDGESVASSLPWNDSVIDVSGAWELTHGRSDVVVAIVDGAPDVGHPALAGKFFAPLEDALYFSADRATSSHSTNIASIVAGESAEVNGIAPGVRLLPLVVNLSSQNYAERAEALATATEIARTGHWNGQSVSRLVVSCSWRTSGDIAVIRTALADLAGANALIVCSAGNDDTDTAHYPSDYGSAAGLLGAGIASIAATQKDDRKADYSNYSASITVSAPGGDGLPLDNRDILCADQGGTYDWAAGTSMAAPHVAAVAALMLSVNPALTPADLKRLIRESADDISGQNPGYEGQLGAGRVNARRAVQAAAALAATVTPGPVDTTGGPGTPDVPPPVDGTTVPAAPAPAGSGPTFHAAAVIPPDVYRKVQQRLTQLNNELIVLTGWTVTTAILSDGGAEVTLEV